MTIQQEVIAAIAAARAALPDLPPAASAVPVQVEATRDPAHGDLATNLALMMAKPAGQPPRALATQLAERLKEVPLFAAVAVAGPGFINFTIAAARWQQEVPHILAAGPRYGDRTAEQGAKVNVEYVSANPTGPMHAGHVRGAVIGDALANLLAKAGYDVTREYYFNDAGAQVDVLARTTHLRYREALGEAIGPIPEGYYPGEYLKEVAAALVARDGTRWQQAPETEWLAPVRDFAVAQIMAMIRADLELIGIRHQVFTNERELIDNGTLETAFADLVARDLIYQGTLPPPKGKEMADWEPAELTLFRSSRFGDSQDRPLRKRDGSWAYIMPDIAYHYDKIRRGFTLLINCLGTDHGGYLEKMRPVVAAFSGGAATLDVIFNGMVKILRNGEPVKLSKRSGNLITLREMVEECGAGAVRFMMLSRTPDSPLEFDFARVVEETRDNPVFYVQYAHARCCSVLRLAAEAGHPTTDPALIATPMAPLCASEELALIRKMALWPQTVEAAAAAREPHRIAFFVGELAGLFHALWNRGKEDVAMRFLIEAQPDLTRARLALVRATALVLASGLQVMGVCPLEELRG